MKKLNQILAVILAAGALLATPGCALFSKNTPKADRAAQINAACYAAATVGVRLAVDAAPDSANKFLLAYQRLDILVNTQVINGATLRNIIDGLPVPELTDGNTKIYIDAATLLIDAAIGNRITLESAPIVLAAATGIRDGMKVALHQ